MIAFCSVYKNQSLGTQAPDLRYVKVKKSCRYQNIVFRNLFEQIKRCIFRRKRSGLIWQKSLHTSNVFDFEK